MAKSAVHLNGNILAAIDVETTGLDWTKHDIVQIAVVPLDSNCDPSKDIKPFVYLMAPREERLMNVEKRALEVCNLSLTKLMNVHDQWTVVDRFVEWFEKLPLGMGKQLVPLAHNWPFDRDFVRDWLGVPSFELFFSGHYRDTQTLALAINDLMDVHADPVAMFTRYGLGDVSRALGIVNEKPHDALWDCLTTAKVYKELLRRVRVW